MKKSILVLILFGFSSYLSTGSYAQVPEWKWAASASGTLNETGTAVAVDPSGDAYVTGNFNSYTVSFGSFTLTNMGWGAPDIFLVKYDAGGNVLWAKSAGGTDIDGVTSVALDTSGNAYITGYFYSPAIVFGTDTLTNAGAVTPDIFLVKYDAGGNVLWARSAGGSQSDGGNSVAVDASGNVFMTGYFYSPLITFGSITLTNAGNYDMFLVKYDANGNVLWAKNAGGTDIDWGASVALDHSGNPYVTGYFYSPAIVFGSNTLTNANPGLADVFLVKYDSGGNVLWAKSAGGTGSDRGNAVAVDASGNACVTGSFYSPIIIFGPDTITNAGDADIFLLKYDQNGNELWAKSAGGTAEDAAASVTMDAPGNAYLTGYFKSAALIFDSINLTNTFAGFSDLFLVKYNSGGNVLWATSTGGPGNDEGNSAALDTTGNAYLTGDFYGPTITFGSYTLTNTGNSDMFLSKIESGISSGIREPGNTFGLAIYPNPATDKISISGTPLHGTLNIMNLNGQQLLQQQIDKPNNTIDISTLPGGVYLIRVVGEKGVQVEKFVKK